MSPTAPALSFFAGIRNRTDGRRRKQSHADNDERKLTKELPSEQETEIDLELGLLMINGVWVKRRVVVSKKVITFAKVSSEVAMSCDGSQLLDAIPMFQILSVRSMMEDDRNVSRNSKGKDDHANDQPDANSVEVLKAGSDDVLKGGLANAHNQSQADLRVDEKQSSLASHGPKFDELEEDKMVRGKAQADTKKNQKRKKGASTSIFNNTLEITTMVDGYNSGRTYYLQANSDVQCRELLEQLQNLSRTAREKHEAKSRMQKLREAVRKVYTSTASQAAVGALILGNFACSVIEAQMNGDLTDDNGDPTALSNLLSQMDNFFIAIFTIELAVNMFSHWFWRFFSDSWSLFDLVIVVGSLIALGPIPLPSAILRLMRAFRIIRLFGRIKAVKQIISALTQSIFPVMNAFLIMFVALCIYAIIGVSFFSDDDPDDFSKFDRSFVTLFKILSGDTWPDNLQETTDDGDVVVANIFFILSMRMLVDWILLQVSVAVLLDKFVCATAQLEAEESQAREEKEKRGSRMSNPLDPFLDMLATDYVDDADMSSKISHYFREMDSDLSGCISFDELCEQMKKLDFEPPIHLSKADFDILTQNGVLCNEKEEMGLEQFEIAIRAQLKLYIQRRMTDVLKLGSASEQFITEISALKGVVATQQRMEKSMEALQETTAGLHSAMSAIQQSLLDLRGETISGRKGQGGRCYDCQHSNSGPRNPPAPPAKEALRLNGHRYIPLQLQAAAAAASAPHGPTTPQPPVAAGPMTPAEANKGKAAAAAASEAAAANSVSQAVPASPISRDVRRVKLIPMPAVADFRKRLDFNPISVFEPKMLDYTSGDAQTGVHQLEDNEDLSDWLAPSVSKADGAAALEAEAASIHTQPVLADSGALIWKADPSRWPPISLLEEEPVPPALPLVHRDQSPSDWRHALHSDSTPTLSAVDDGSADAVSVSGWAGDLEAAAAAAHTAAAAHAVAAAQALERAGTLGVAAARYRGQSSPVRLLEPVSSLSARKGKRPEL